MTTVTAAESGRITSHMNGDHGSSLVHYLEHFGRISAPVDPKITVFSTPEMVIEYGKSGNRKTWSHKFNPPMMAGEARKRLEEMHRVARQGLGLSEVTINTFTLNTTAATLLLGATVLELLLLVSPSASIIHYTPWAVKYATALLGYLSIAPSTSAIGMGIKALLLGPIWGIHALEALFFLVPLMRRFNTTSPLVRLQYVVATVIGGVPIWQFFRTKGESEEFEQKKTK